MSDILSRVAASRKRIVPESVDDFVGLQITRALRDETHAYDYLLLARRTNARILISAFRAIRPLVGSERPVLDLFVTALTDATAHQPPLAVSSLIAVAVGPQRVALAVFRGLQLEHVQVRTLQTSLTKARITAAAFTRWALTHFPDCGVVIENQRGADDTVRSKLLQSVADAARESAVPFSQVPASELLSAYAQPGCKTRGDFRKIIALMWPSLTLDVTDRTLLDAIGLGLLAQVKRQLDGEPAGASQ